MNYWGKKEKLFKYIDGVREFFPLANEQLDTIFRIIEKFNPTINTFLDLGCGDGFIGYFIGNLYPNSQGVFLDSSNEMLNKARQKDLNNKYEFVVQDFGSVNWYNKIKTTKKFDLIISGFSIHHISNEKKKRLYSDIFHMLNPNGIFLNLEHVSSPSDKFEELFSELFDDAMFDYQKHIGDEKSKDEIKEIYSNPDHKKLNILESVELQCSWLKEIGFSDVDCYMKIFEMALFGGFKTTMIK
jgi:ubiquinone/menaquinone biosynthesis C-methylase UbiE